MGSYFLKIYIYIYIFFFFFFVRVFFLYLYVFRFTCKFIDKKRTILKFVCYINHCLILLGVVGACYLFLKLNFMTRGQ